MDIEDESRGSDPRRYATNTRKVYLSEKFVKFSPNRWIVDKWRPDWFQSGVVTFGVGLKTSMIGMIVQIACEVVTGEKEKCEIVHHHLFEWGKHIHWLLQQNYGMKILSPVSRFIDVRVKWKWAPNSTPNEMCSTTKSISVFSTRWSSHCSLVITWRSWPFIACTSKSNRQEQFRSIAWKVNLNFEFTHGPSENLSTWWWCKLALQLRHPSNFFRTGRVIVSRRSWRLLRKTNCVGYNPFVLNFVALFLAVRYKSHLQIHVPFP